MFHVEHYGGNLISLAEVVTSPEFAQPIVGTRSSGFFGRGGFIGTADPLPPMIGIIQPATDEDLVQVPEGDRVTGMMSFITPLQLYKTHTQGGSAEAGLGDTVVWRGQSYRIVTSTPWGDFGFWKAIGSRQSGA